MVGKCHDNIPNYVVMQMYKIYMYVIMDMQWPNTSKAKNTPAIVVLWVPFRIYAEGDFINIQTNGEWLHSLRTRDVTSVNCGQ